MTLPFTVVDFTQTDWTSLHAYPSVHPCESRPRMGIGSGLV
jgi:hypothetical protein